MKKILKLMTLRSVPMVIFTVLLTIFICAGLSLISCKAATEGKIEQPESGPTIIEGKVNAVTVDEAFRIFSEKNTDYLFLDVRTTEEFAEGHIENAILIPLSELEGRIDELPLDRAIIVYCKSGNRSTQASNLLVEKGFKKILNMEGGITEWKSKGYPLVTD